MGGVNAYLRYLTHVNANGNNAMYHITPIATLSCAVFTWMNLWPKLFAFVIINRCLSAQDEGSTSTTESGSEWAWASQS